MVVLGILVIGCFILNVASSYSALEERALILKQCDRLERKIRELKESINDSKSIRSDE